MLEAIKYVQSIHDNINEESTRITVLEMFFNEKYRSCLNDYTHIISTHSNHLESIYKQLKKCDLSKCEMARRCNHNDRRSKNNNNGIEEQDTDTTRFYVDLIYRIHFWLYHQFDVGMRVQTNVIDEKDDGETEEKPNNFEAEFSTMKRKVFSKRDEWKKRELESRQTNRIDKYTLKVDENVLSTDFIDADKTYLDSMYLQLENEGIPIDTIASFFKFLSDEEYDTDAVIADIINVSKGSNIIDFSKLCQFRSFFQEISQDYGGMLIVLLYNTYCFKFATTKQ